MIAPRYQNLDGDLVTLLSSPDGGALVRVIAGEIAGHRGPGSTHTPITVAHLTLSPGAQITLPWQRDFNALAYVLSGRGTAGAEAVPVQSGQLAVFGAGDTITLTAADGETLDVYLLGGRPIGEPVAAYGPFVMNTRAELAQAFEDYQAGRLGTIPADGLMPLPPAVAQPAAIRPTIASSTAGLVAKLRRTNPSPIDPKRRPAASSTPRRRNSAAGSPPRPSAVQSSQARYVAAGS